MFFCTLQIRMVLATPTYKGAPSVRLLPL